MTIMFGLKSLKIKNKSSYYEEFETKKGFRLFRLYFKDYTTSDHFLYPYMDDRDNDGMVGE